jgi:hypothetical protein
MNRKISTKINENKFMKYKKLPVTIEAYQTDKEISIETLEGTMKANKGDWIIKGVNGEIYPCKPDIFEKTYEPAVEVKDAVATTIEQEPKWIPCSERLPEENEPVLVGIRYKDNFKMFVTARRDVTYWHGLGRDIKGEMRWMPLPEPYKESDE